MNVTTLKIGKNDTFSVIFTHCGRLSDVHVNVRSMYCSSAIALKIVCAIQIRFQSKISFETFTRDFSRQFFSVLISIFNIAYKSAKKLVLAFSFFSSAFAPPTTTASGANALTNCTKWFLDPISFGF